MLLKSGEITPRTQKVISGISEVGAAHRRGTASGRRTRWDGDTVTDNDCVIAYKHLLDDEAHDALPLDDVQSVGCHAQPRQERRECLREAQVRGSLLGL